MPTKTNETTVAILDYLLLHHIPARRINVLGVPITRDGAMVGYRPSTMVGMPDILGWIPPSGRGLCVEVKTGHDRLRPEQITFLDLMRKAGCIVLVVKDFEDFEKQLTEALALVSA